MPGGIHGVLPFLWLYYVASILSVLIFHLPEKSTKRTSPSKSTTGAEEQPRTNCTGKGNHLNMALVEALFHVGDLIEVLGARQLARVARACIARGEPFSP